MTEPQPGEVWVITEPKYGSDSWKVITDYGPFIVTYITRCTIGIVAVGDGTEPVKHSYRRGEWDWDKHATRVWPPVPTWEELVNSPMLTSDDLRAQAME